MDLEKKIEEAYTSGCLRIHVQDLFAAAPLFEAESIKELEIYGLFTDSWPSFMEKCHALKSLTLRVGELTEFPTWIRNAVSLERLSIEHPNFEYLPDWISDLQSLTELSVNFSRDDNVLYDIHDNQKKIPSRHNFTDFKKLRSLPDSIGKLKNLVKLDLSGLPIESLPDSIVNCAYLEYVDIRQTNINSPPNSISSVKTVKRSVGIIPKEHSISYRTFCNCYYKLSETIIRFSAKSRKDGLFSFEDDLKDFSDDIFSEGTKLMLDGTDEKTIRHIFTLRMEREHDYYRKKLMEIAMEGIICIQQGIHTWSTAFIIAALVDIKDNPLEAALKDYYSGDSFSMEDIDFEAAIQQEEEREEVRFIKRARFLGKIVREADYWLGLEKYLDREGIASRDIFEFGLLYVVNGTDREEIDKILSTLITRETDPVRKNLALAKKDAVLMIHNCDHPHIIKNTLFSYFDESITGDLSLNYDL